MSPNINFLLRKDEELLKRQTRAKVFNFAAIIFLIGLGAVSLAIFLSIQAMAVPSLREERSAVQRKIANFQNRRVKLLVLNSRLESIQKIFEKRQADLAKKQNVAKMTNALLEKVPDNLSIGALEIDEKIVLLTAKSTSLFPIGQLINALTDMAKKKEIISSLTLESLVFEESANSFQVSLKAEI